MEESGVSDVAKTKDTHTYTENISVVQAFCTHMTHMHRYTHACAHTVQNTKRTPAFHPFAIAQFTDPSSSRNTPPDGSLHNQGHVKMVEHSFEKAVVRAAGWRLSVAAKSYRLKLTLVLSVTFQASHIDDILAVHVHAPVCGHTKNPRSTKCG